MLLVSLALALLIPHPKHRSLALLEDTTHSFLSMMIGLVLSYTNAHREQSHSCQKEALALTLVAESKLWEAAMMLRQLITVTAVTTSPVQTATILTLL